MAERYARNHDKYLANYRRTGIKHVIDKVRTVSALRKVSFPLPFFFFLFSPCLSLSLSLSPEWKGISLRGDCATV